jgi:hypothetical protein
MEKFCLVFLVSLIPRSSHTSGQKVNRKVSKRIRKSDYKVKSSSELMNCSIDAVISSALTSCCMSRIEKSYINSITRIARARDYLFMKCI